MFRRYVSGRYRKVFKKAKELVPETDNMCYSGEKALNCVLTH